jgi:predicted nuclease of predicted toxin-antitoxin system
VNARCRSQPVNEVPDRQRAVAGAHRAPPRSRAVHVRDIDLQYADDEVIFEHAALDGSILVSADTDFGTLLATRSASKLSFILFRGRGSRRPDVLARVILANLPDLADSLDAGCVATFEPSRIRIRMLPIT